MTMMDPNAGNITASCRTGSIEECRTGCYGFVAPLRYGSERPCEHVCHTSGQGNARNYQRALELARAQQSDR